MKQREYKTISEVRASLDENFEKTFFERTTMRMHRDKKRHWSENKQVLIITAQDDSISMFKVTDYHGKIKLMVVNDTFCPVMVTDLELTLQTQREFYDGYLLPFSILLQGWFRMGINMSETDLVDKLAKKIREYLDSRKNNLSGYNNDCCTDADIAEVAKRFIYSDLAEFELGNFFEGVK